MAQMENIQRLPDITQHSSPSVSGALDQVGMDDIELLLNLEVAGETVRTVARASAFVNLEREDARGIHMSRLYERLTSQLNESPLTPLLLNSILKLFLESHQGLSSRAFLSLDFALPLWRKALISDKRGLRSYPIKIRALKDEKGFRNELQFRVTYSSTCPCSAALARQLIQDNFKKTFAGRSLNFEELHEWLGSEAGIIATPHSQRSSADVTLVLDPENKNYSIEKFIDIVEASLMTPVQTAVKREDEQEFTRLNGANLMFCEDAARRIKASLLPLDLAKDFFIRVAHHESLHPHDAVAVAVKGVEDGFVADFR